MSSVVTLVNWPTTLPRKVSLTLLWKSIITQAKMLKIWVTWWVSTLITILLNDRWQRFLLHHILGRNSGYYNFCYAKCSQQIYKGSVFSYDFQFGHFFLFSVTRLWIKDSCRLNWTICRFKVYLETVPWIALLMRKYSQSVF